MASNVNRFEQLYSLFTYAVSQKLQYPKIRLQLGNETIIVKLAGAKSKYNGQLMVTNDAEYGSPNNKYFGRVDNAGAIYAGRDLTPEVEGLLEMFAANPVEVAQRYGKLTGNCMFCGKLLTDETGVSQACGYGPVCAKKWGLPHSAAAQAKKSRREGSQADQAAVETLAGFSTFEEPAARPTQNFMFDALDNAKEAACDTEMALDEIRRREEKALQQEINLKNAGMDV